MPTHGVWCQVAVAEARERRRSGPLDTWRARVECGGGKLEAVLEGLPAMVHEDRGAMLLGQDAHDMLDGKHVQQESSIIGHILSVGKLHGSATESFAFVDFCSGRGTLSDHLHAVLAADRNVTGESLKFVLVDWASLKVGHCRDGRMRSKGAHVTRVEADIADLCLADVPLLRETGPVAGYTKHACGPATDAVLRCVATFDAGRTKLPPTALILAPCCHHRCTWATYEGQAFFASLGLTSDDFATAVALSPWATLAEQSKGTQHALPLPDDEEALPGGPSPTFDRKVWLGRRCKHLLDLGRLHALKARGCFESVRLVQYTTLSVEDRLLVAWPRPTALDQ